MSKFWLVCKHEYLRHVRTRRFIFGVLSMPIFFALVIGIGVLSAKLGADLRPIGIVDSPNVLMNPQGYKVETGDFTSKIAIIEYASESEGRAAVNAKEIQGVFILSEDYLQTGKVTLVSEKALDSPPISIFRQFVVDSLLQSQPTELAERLSAGPDIVVKALDEQRQSSGDNFLGIFAPILSGVLLMIAIVTSGGYLVQAITDEKENRTIEILLTSISHNQFMAGKVIGNLSVGLTQLLIWLSAAVIALLILMNSNLDIFQSLGEIKLNFLWVTIATFLPGFVMISALMAMVGATAVEAKEAQQVTGLFTLPLAIPLWTLPAIIETPNSAIAVALSLIPFTSPITLPMRVVYTQVPDWQIILSITILFLSAFGAIWLASRALRLGMLRYGKKIKLREIFHRQTI